MPVILTTSKSTAISVLQEAGAIRECIGCNSGAQRDQRAEVESARSEGAPGKERRACLYWRLSLVYVAIGGQIARWCIVGFVARFRLQSSHPRREAAFPALPPAVVLQKFLEFPDH